MLLARIVPELPDHVRDAGQRQGRQLSATAHSTAALAFANNAVKASGAAAALANNAAVYPLVMFLRIITPGTGGVTARWVSVNSFRVESP